MKNKNWKNYQHTLSKVNKLNKIKKKNKLHIIKQRIDYALIYSKVKLK